MAHQIHPQPVPSEHQNSIRQYIKGSLKLSNLALIGGEGLSIVDLIFDIAMMVEFNRNEETAGFATATMTTLILNVTFQLFLAINQNSKRGAKVIIRETFFAITLVKPGVDVYRVVAGHKTPAHARFDPLTEMAVTKAIELSFECIPGEGY